MNANVGYQSLYRRYRSQTFSEIKGQTYVVRALRRSVAEGCYSHAYLFSGPRGTGKTSMARILAKALNCDYLDAGDPCGVCKSCIDIQNGASLDVHELDAASNNKVDDIRELIAKVNLGSPGRTKVYILDEVHMLSSAAENALLKTLENPPKHVVFILATTEFQNVALTIRSRTQHLEFKLLSSDELIDHIRWIIKDAHLDVDETGIEYVIRKGGGSVRDTLSALELVAASGFAADISFDVATDIALAIGAGDPAAAIAAVEYGVTNGLEPRVIGENIIEVLRPAFLASNDFIPRGLDEMAKNNATKLVSSLGRATIVRSMEMVGQALIEMRQSPDPRVPLEVTLLRLTRRDGVDLSGVLQRIEVLEKQVESFTQERHMG